MARNWKQGRVRVTKKDNGYYKDEGVIPYRSSYELKAIKYVTMLYKAGRIKEWQYEESIFEYYFPLDNKNHRYFMDFTVTLIDGTVVFIEVKPFSEVIPPKKPRSGKETNSYQQSVVTWVKNQSKWQAVEKWCKENSSEQRRYKFTKWTEKELNIRN